MVLHPTEERKIFENSLFNVIMKNNEIHQGLPNKEVRDFLSEQLTDSRYSTPPQEEMPPPSSMDNLDWAILSAERTRNLAANQLEYLKRTKAVYILMKKMGWTEWDVSDETTRVGEHWLSFLGTEEEYNNLIKQIENEKNA